MNYTHKKKEIRKVGNIMIINIILEGIINNIYEFKQEQNNNNNDNNGWENNENDNK